VTPFEYIARLFYQCYLRRGGLTGSQPEPPLSFSKYISKWQAAQQSGKEEDWRQVQFFITANDVQTEGYKVENMAVWPMFFGKPPEDVRAITEYGIAVTKPDSVVNYEGRHGINLDGAKLYVYLVYNGGVGTDAWYLLAPMADIRSVILGGKYRSSGNPDKDLINILYWRYGPTIKITRK